ncbi:MAG: hypothetical protein HKP30_13770, partial [Myxococcales bacterium]|nr:hypothetical protein [Myxococcales bacterium]
MKMTTAAIGGLLLALTLNPLAGRAATVDFEDLAPGTIVSEVFSSAPESIGPIGVFGVNPQAAGLNAAVIFDSAAPNGDPCGGGLDLDLGTPNEAFGGPGVGDAGASNTEALGNLLIVNEACGLGGASVDRPNDADNPDSPISFDFSAIGPVTINSLSLIDVEAAEAPATVELFDAGGGLLADFVLPQTGDNGVIRNSPLGPTPDVTFMVVTLGGSGAIDELDFDLEPPVCSLGDFVFLDENEDGIQDPLDLAIADVKLNLT